LFNLDDAGRLMERLDGVHVVLSIRSDRLAEASGIPSVARLVERGLFLLGGIGAEGLRAAVEQPALQCGLVLEPGLVDLLLRDVENEPAALPMFSHALVETWRRREGQNLTIDGYLAAGGVRGAIAQTAESVHAALDPSRHRELRSLMLRMVRTDDEGETSRTRVLRSRTGAADDLVEMLVAARLLTSDGEGLTLTHEALVTAWPRFRDWLADDVEGRRHFQHLAQAAGTWDEMGRPDSELYRGTRLERALEWVGTTEIELSEPEQDFLTASRDAQHAEQERERRTLVRERRINRRLRVLAGGLAAVTALALLIGVLAIDQQRKAVTEARASAAAELEADAHRVAALALNTEDASLSLLLAVAAQRLAPGSVTERSLSATLAARPELIATATPMADTHAPASGLGGLASSGARVYGLDGLHVLHVFTTGLRRLGTVDLGNGTINRSPPRLAVTPNLIAATSGPGNGPAIVVLDARTLDPEPIRLERLPQHDVRVDSLDLSADARTLAAALGTRGGDIVMTWQLPSGSLLGPPIRVRDRTTVRLSDDRRRLFTSNPMNAYDVASGRLLWHAPRAGGLDVHEDVVAAAAIDGSAVRILNASTGGIVRTLTGNQGPAVDLAFSPNGASLAAHVGGGTVTVWNAVTGRIEHSLRTGAQRGIAYSAFSDTLYTGGSRLGSLLAWDLQGRRSFLTRIAVDGFQSLSAGLVRVSPDGSWVSMSRTAGENPELRLGRARPDSEIQVIVPAAGWRGVGAWSADASRYVYSDRGGFLTIVNPADGSRLVRRRVAARPIVGVANPDGRLLVALVEGDQLIIADAQTLDVRLRVALPAVGAGLTATAEVALVTSAEAEGGASWEVPVTKWHLVDLDDGAVVADGDVAVGNASISALSLDGARIAFGGKEGDLAIVDVSSGDVVGSIGEGAGEPVEALAWSSDGSGLLVNIGSGLQLWDARRGIEIARVELPVGEVSAAAGFAEDGTITIATQAGNIYRWDASAEAAADFACRVAGRDISPAEWRNALGNRPIQSVCS
jgi:WD40 repeat protein